MITTIELSCMSCSKSFNRNLSLHNANVKRGRKLITCSRACLATLKAKAPISKTCLSCGNSFERKQTSHDKLLYCSRVCMLSKQHHLANKQPRVKPNHLCKTCKVTPLSGSRILCNSCKLLKLNTPKQYTLQELRSKYSISQYHAKIRGLSRSEYFQHNDAERTTCKICGYSLHVDICHIKELHEFPETATLAEVNHLSNLVALCKNHHWEMDNGYLMLRKLDSNQ